MAKNAVRTTLGCLLAAILLAGCDKDEAPKAASPQATETRAEADAIPWGRGIVSEAARPALTRCEAMLRAAESRGASGNAEVEEILESKTCNPD